MAYYPPTLMPCWSPHLNATVVHILITIYEEHKDFPHGMTIPEVSQWIEEEEEFVAETMGWMVGMGLIRFNKTDSSRYIPTSMLTKPPTDEWLSKLEGDRNTPRASHARDPNRYAPTRPRVGECISFGDDSDNDACIESGSLSGDSLDSDQSNQSEQCSDSIQSPDPPSLPPSGEQASDPKRSERTGMTEYKPNDDPDHGKKLALFYDLGINNSDALKVTARDGDRMTPALSLPIKELQVRHDWSMSPGIENPSGHFITKLNFRGHDPIPPRFRTDRMGRLEPPKAFGPEDVRVNARQDSPPVTREERRRDAEERPLYIAPNGQEVFHSSDEDNPKEKPNDLTPEDRAEMLRNVIAKGGNEHYRKTGIRTRLGRIQGKPLLVPTREEREQKQQKWREAKQSLYDERGILTPLGEMTPLLQEDGTPTLGWPLNAKGVLNYHDEDGNLVPYFDAFGNHTPLGRKVFRMDVKWGPPPPMVNTHSPAQQGSSGLMSLGQIIEGMVNPQSTSKSDIPTRTPGAMADAMAEAQGRLFDEEKEEENE